MMAQILGSELPPRLREGWIEMSTASQWGRYEIGFSDEEPDDLIVYTDINFGQDRIIHYSWTMPEDWRTRADKLFNMDGIRVLRHDDNVGLTGEWISKEQLYRQVRIDSGDYCDEGSTRRICFINYVSGGLSSYRAEWPIAWYDEDRQIFHNRDEQAIELNGVIVKRERGEIYYKVQSLIDLGIYKPEIYIRSTVYLSIADLIKLGIMD